jgi:DNA invertase Pin-like site-specific DNA recombinase
MNKITPEHLAREAYVYVRQSTADQLLNNPESRRRQYALVARARALGWENAIVIDDDLGRSGDGQVRPGFERLLAAISAGTAGAVLAIEASRLARNGRDWHTLLEFCAFVNSLIIDEDGIYDPRLVNDRLLLGLKGTFSELELSIFRQRSQEALRLKAARGELYTTVAIGYRRSVDDRAVAPAAIQYCSSAADKSGLCRRLCFWPHRLARPVRRQTQSHHSRCSAPARRVGGADPRPP